MILPQRGHLLIASGGGGVNTPRLGSARYGALLYSIGFFLLTGGAYGHGFLT
ncbi:MAG: hypothetical protein ACK4GN_18665 [Runella sp.]